MVSNNELTIFWRENVAWNFSDVRSQRTVKMGIELAARLDNVVQHSRELLSVLPLWNRLEPVWIWGRADLPHNRVFTGKLG